MDERRAHGAGGGARRGLRRGPDRQRGRREAFRATRDAGAGVLEHGHAEGHDIGPRLAAVADGLEAIIAAHPTLGPVLSGLARAARATEDGEALAAELEATRAPWETAARSGAYDDAVMDAVDRLIGRAARLAGVHGTDEHGDDHDFGAHHPRDTGEHDHGGRNETAFRSRLDALQANRGANAVQAGQGVGADRLETAAEPIIRTIRMVFDHPYESDWWYPTVQGWCEQHGDVLGGSIRGRNAGVMHSHAH